TFLNLCISPIYFQDSTHYSGGLWPRVSEGLGYDEQRNVGVGFYRRVAVAALGPGALCAPRPAQAYLAPRRSRGDGEEGSRSRPGANHTRVRLHRQVTTHPVTTPGRTAPSRRFGPGFRFGRQVLASPLTAPLPNSSVQYTYTQ